MFVGTLSVGVLSRPTWVGLWPVWIDDLNRSLSLLFLQFVRLVEFCKLLLHVVVQLLVAWFVGFFVNLNAHHAFPVSGWVVLCVLGWRAGRSRSRVWGRRRR